MTCVSVNGESLPTSVFARRPGMHEVRISPDGRRLLYVTTRQNHALVATVDLDGPSEPVHALLGSARDEVIWCRWVNTTRFTCGVRRASTRGTSQHPRARTSLVAVNADGTNAGIVFDFNSARDVFEHQIVDVRSSDERSILLQTFGARAKGARPEVWRLDVESGECETVARASRSMPRRVNFIGDADRGVLVANSLLGSNRIYWVSFGERPEWREFLRYDVFRDPPSPIPFAIAPGAHHAYGIGRGKQYRALFQIDLSNAAANRLIYESPEADVREPIIAGDGQLVGMRLDTERPSVHYLNRRDANAISRIDKLLPDRSNEIVDATASRDVMVIRSSNDVDAGTYYLFDARNGDTKLQLLGTAYPELDPTKLPRMQAFDIKKDAATTFRAFLTRPLATPVKNPPLVVMPDDGPNGRSEWRFSFLRHFLVSRGYTVLQLQLDDATSARNYYAVRQDLNGSAYALLRNGARWAIDRGVADAHRIAIMGWGFGGYLALLASQRDPDLFQCAIAVNAVTDLREQAGNHSTEGLIGHMPSHFSRSLVRHRSSKTRAPALLIYGSHDTVVHPHHAHRLSLPLSPDGNYERLEIEYGTHELSDPEARARMLDAVDRFLSSQLSE
jgi:dipeptidyl aminopeptidase/acylaminoacyl peptidase